MLISVPFEMQENIICQMEKDSRWEKKCSFQASKSSDNGEKNTIKSRQLLFQDFVFNVLCMINCTQLLFWSRE